MGVSVLPSVAVEGELRSATLNIGAQGWPPPESYPEDPVDLVRLLKADGTYHPRAVASVLKRRGVERAYARSLGSCAELYERDTRDTRVAWVQGLKNDGRNVEAAALMTKLVPPPGDEDWAILFAP
jgi:hypothetical protein